MATNARTRQEGTDPRPRTYLLGVDTQGAHHLHHTPTDEILVVADGRLTHRFAIDPWDDGAPGVDDYIRHVAERVTDREWRERHYLTAGEGWL